MTTLADPSGMRTLHRIQLKGSLLALSVAFLVAVAGQGAAHGAGNPLVSTQASSSGYPGRESGL